MQLSIEPRQSSDGNAIAELYRRNHRLDSGRLRLEPDQGAQTFVARASSRIVGMVIMTYFDDGVHRYGILHVLEVDQPQARYANEVTFALIDACRAWLQQRHTDQLLAAPPFGAPIAVDRMQRMPEPVQLPRSYMV